MLLVGTEVPAAPAEDSGWVQAADALPLWLRSLGLRKPVGEVVVFELLVFRRAARVRVGFVKRFTVDGGGLGLLPALLAGQALKGLDVHDSGLRFSDLAPVLRDGSMQSDKLGLARFTNVIEAEFLHRRRAEICRSCESARLTPGQPSKVLTQRFDVDLFIHSWIINPFMDKRQARKLSFYG